MKDKEVRKNLWKNLKQGEKTLEVKSITKKFPGVIANDNIDFDLKAGEVHGIVGENGAGKTTLMNIIHGLYGPDKGNIYVRNQKVRFNSPSDSIRMGIGMVHQHPKLVPIFTALENIMLGHPKTEMKINKEEVDNEVSSLVEKYGLEVNLDEKVRDLDAGESKMVEILKVLYRGAKILILDEPSTSLTPQQRKNLIDAVKTMAKEDLTSVIYITHKLSETLEACDRITVLRDGKKIGTVSAKKTEFSELSKMMVGKEISFDQARSKGEIKSGLLKVRNLEVFDDRGIKAVKNISFSLRKGEILGIAGISGNGQGDLVQALIGMRKASGGKINFLGEDITNKSPFDRKKRGIGYIPAERLRLGCLENLSLVDNIALEYYYREGLAKKGLLDYRYLEKLTKDLVEEYDVACPNIETKIKHLSGGNIQKIIFARVLSSSPKMLIANLPTQGLDLGTQEFGRKRLIEAKEEGLGILLVSEDLDEILMLSDRVAPIYEGRFVDIVPIEDANKTKIGEMMLGK